MRHKFRCPPPLLRIIEHQSGVLTTQQAVSFGASRTVLDRLRSEGHWHPVTRGLWSITPEPTWLGLAWGGLLIAGPEAVIGGAAASHLWGASPEPERIDVWAPKGLRPRDGPWQFRQGEAYGRGTPSRVSLEDATLEVCAAVSGTDQVMDALGRALRTRGTTSERLAARAAAHPHLRNHKLIVEMLAACDVGVESPLELRYLRDVERAHRLPVGRRQARLRLGTRVDVSYDDYGLVVELDGSLWHRGLAAHVDMNRDNLNIVDGRRTLRYGWPAIGDHPCRSAHQTAGALRLGGWVGEVAACRRCR